MFCCPGEELCPLPLELFLGSPVKGMFSSFPIPGFGGIGSASEKSVNADRPERIELERARAVAEREEGETKGRRGDG